MVTGRLKADASEFADYLGDWHESLRPLSIEQVIADANGPEHVGIFCVDMINGFCHEGALQSDRVKSIIAPIIDLMERSYRFGIRNFVLTQDSHRADAVEFIDFPPHCIAGTFEAETIPEIATLPFASEFTVVRKHSLNSAIGTSLDDWLTAHPGMTHRIVVGDCTDLCTYQLAMHLKLTANAANRLNPVIIPADCVQTYDVAVDVARGLGIKAHPGNIFHLIFLYHMALNGCRLVTNLT